MSNVYTPNHCNRSNDRILSDDHGQKLKYQVVAYSHMPVKGAFSGDLINPLHHPDMVLITFNAHSPYPPSNGRYNKKLR